MIPVFASDILKVGADGFGLLNAASDIGSMMIIVTLSFIPLKKKSGQNFNLVSWLDLVCASLVSGLSKLYWLSFLIPYVERNFDGISVVIRGTIVQLKTQITSEEE